MYEAKLKEFDETGDNLIQNLENKRSILVKKALKLEKEYLFGAASDLYEQCVEISLKLMKLGKKQEYIIAKFKKMKEKCLQKISKK